MATRGRPTPSRILELSWGLARTATLVAALELDVFTEISRDQRTVAALAARTGASHRGLEALLVGLCATGLVHHDGDGRYELADDAAMYLVHDSPAYLGDLRHVHRELNFAVWPRLTDAVRDGTPRRELFADRADDVWAKVAPYLDALGAGTGRWIASVAADCVAAEPRVLDVGCGHGGCGRALAHAWGGTLLGVDRASCVAAARTRAVDAGLAERASYAEVDLLEDDWGGPFDVVLLGNLLHGYDRDRVGRLLARARGALADGGALLINEILPDDAETDSIGPFFALEMLLTSEGAAHRFADYAAWLADAGLPVARYHRSPVGPNTLLIATPRGLS
jgi:SAM-dependent methyltransferase